MVRAVSPWGWARFSTIMVLPAFLLMIWWRGLPDAFLWTLGKTVVLMAGVALLQAASAWWFNQTARLHGGIRMWWGGTELVACWPGSTALPALLVAPAAILLGLLVHALDLFRSPPLGWAWFIWVALPVAQVCFMVGTAWLYTRVIVSVSHPLVWKEETVSAADADNAPTSVGHKTVRICEMDASRFRTVTATLIFSWIALGALAAILVLLLGLTVLAHRVPAGYFGIGVALFVGFVVAIVGFLLAVAGGLWAGTIARWYNRRASRGQGLTLAATRRPLVP